MLGSSRVAVVARFLSLVDAESFCNVFWLLCVGVWQRMKSYCVVVVVVLLRDICCVEKVSRKNWRLIERILLPWVL